MTTNLSQERKLSVACVLLKMWSAVHLVKLYFSVGFTNEGGRKEGGCWAQAAATFG